MGHKYQTWNLEKWRSSCCSQDINIPIAAVIAKMELPATTIAAIWCNFKRNFAVTIPPVNTPNAAIIAPPKPTTQRQCMHEELHVYMSNHKLITVLHNLTRLRKGGEKEAKEGKGGEWGWKELRNKGGEGANEPPGETFTTWYFMMLSNLAQMGKIW